jgi:hypothetical protein
MRYHFADPTRIVSDQLADKVWTAQPDTPILIQSLAEYNPDEAQKRPAVLVARGDQVPDQAQGMDTRLIGGCGPGNAAKVHVEFYRGSHTIHCVGGREGEEAVLTGEVHRELRGFLPLVWPRICLLRARVARHRGPAEAGGAQGNVRQPDRAGVRVLPGGPAFSRSTRPTWWARSGRSWSRWPSLPCSAGGPVGDFVPWWLLVPGGNVAMPKRVLTAAAALQRNQRMDTSVGAPLRPTIIGPRAALRPVRRRLRARHAVRLRPGRRERGRLAGPGRRRGGRPRLRPALPRRRPPAVFHQAHRFRRVRPGPVDLPEPGPGRQLRLQDG